MNREILFRGKREDNGEWVYGWYTKYAFGRWPIRDCIIPSEIAENGCIKHVEVVPDTISQYTGLTDKNGVKIFEGDIVHILGNQDVEDWKDVDYIAQIVFMDGGFCAIDGTVENHGFRRYNLARRDFEMEVIGNIFDNPGLMEDDT